MKQKLKHIIKLLTGTLSGAVILLYSATAFAKQSLADCALEGFLPDGDDCWFCPLFRIIFNTSSTIALKAYSALADGVASLVLVGFALWVSIFVLKHVSAVEVKNPRKMIQEFLQQTFKVLLVVLILKVSYFQVMGLTLEPVFNTGMAFVQTLTGSQGSCSKNAGYMQNINGYDSKIGLTSGATGGLPVTMGQNIVCSIKAMQDSVSKMMAYGRQAWCVGWRPKAFIPYIIPSFPYIITGAVLYIGALVLLVAFPWCLIDAVLQMTVASALAPAAIGTWPFKSVSKYLSIKKMWDFFMNAMFNFVFLSIILYVIMTVVDQFMDALEQRAASTDDWDFLIHPIDGLAYWGVTGLKLVVVCLMGWVFLDQGRDFANSFAQGADMGDIGRSVGGAFAQAANKVGSTAVKAGKAVARPAMQVADHFLGSRVRKMHTNWRIKRDTAIAKRFGTTIRDKDGNIIAYQYNARNLLGQKRTRRVDIDENGNKSWSKEKHSLKAEIGNKVRSVATNFRNEHIEGISAALEKVGGKKITDGNGRVTGYEYRNLLGQKVTVTQQVRADGSIGLDKQRHSLRMEILGKISKPGSKINQFAQENAVKKTKQLDRVNHSSTKIRSDHLMSVREYKDSNGNIVGRDIAFKPSVIKHLTNADGTINMNMIRQLEAGTRFDQKTLHEAIAKEILKARGLKLDDRFNNRQVVIDNRGILHLRQDNLDNSVTELTMVYGGPNGNQALLQLTTTQEDGSYNTLVDNGIQHKTINYRKGNENAELSYGFSDIYYQRNKHFGPLNRYGEFGAGIDRDAAMFGFNDEDLSSHTEQVRTGHTLVIPVTTR